MSDGTIIIDQPEETVLVNQPEESIVVNLSEETIVQSVEDATVLVSNAEETVLISPEEVTVIISKTEQGPPGRDGEVTARHREIEIDFSQVIAGPIEIGTMIANQKIKDTVISITEFFDGNTKIQVGTIVADAILMTFAESNPDIVGEYYRANNLRPSETDVFRASFMYDSPPTQGKAIITIYFN